MYENRVVELQEVIKRILLKWRLIIISMLIGAVVLNAVGIMQSYKTKQELIAIAQKEKLEKDGTSELLTLKKKLSDREINDVEIMAQTYMIYLEEYKKELEYNKNSILMNLSPEHVSVLKVIFYIDNNYEAVYPVIEKKDTTKDIIDVFNLHLMDDDIFVKVAEAFDNEVDSCYVQELVQVSVSGDSNLVINILGESEEFCTTIAEVLCEKVQELIPKIKDQYGEFDIKEINRLYQENMSSDLSEKQYARVAKINTIKVSMNNLVTSLNDDQKSYYYELVNQYIKSMNMKEDINEEQNEIQTLESTIVIPEVSYINVNFMLGGAFLGALCVCIWVLFSYVFSNKLQMPEDINSVYAIAVLGVFGKNAVNKKFGKIDKFIDLFFGKRDKLYSDEIQIKTICEMIRSFAKDKNAKKIFVMGTVINQEYSELIPKIEKELNDEVQVVFATDTIFNDFGTIKTLAEAEGVLLVEQIEKSKYAEIKEEAEQCKLYKIPILGCVIFE